jgi:hypothetical protein
LLNTAKQNVMAIAPQVQTTVENYRGFVSTLGKDPDKVIRNPFEGIFPPAGGANRPPAAAPAAPAAPTRRQRFNPVTGQLEDV